MMSLEYTHLSFKLMAVALRNRIFCGNNVVEVIAVLQQNTHHSSFIT